MDTLYQQFLTRYLLTPSNISANQEKDQNCAAVLIPIVLHPVTPTLLLTKRSANLRQHPGQVAFPGGKYDKGDRSLLHTALRETEEELGIKASQITTLGQLPRVKSQSNFCVTPYIATLTPPLHVIPNPDEVAHVFEVPLHLALDQLNYSFTSVLRQRKLHAITFLNYPEQMVWGMTASLLYTLAKQMTNRGQ